MPNYTHAQLIEAYFRSIKYSTSKFSTGKCRKYVMRYKKNFDNEIFMKDLAIFLASLDDQLSDYSIDSDFEKEE